jgi:trehalose 6-phosphate synthase
MSGRLIVISNRIPTEEPSSGGLVVALHEALADRGGIWIGSHPDEGPEEGLFPLGESPYTRLAFRLSPEEYENYYLGFSNSVLWPVCHRRSDLVEIRNEYTEAYQALNERLAGLVAEVAEPDDTIWVHDYHLFPLAQDLRAKGVTNRIGLFLHIPFPALGDLSVLPEPEAFAEWLAAFDLVGLQTRADVARCLEMYRADPRAEFLPDWSIKFGERRVSVRSFPIGIDPDEFRKTAETGDQNLFGENRPGEFLIGVDRLDYTKGLPNRFRAFGRYLEEHAGDRGPTLLQIAPPSREQVEAYRQITAELEEIAGQVNGRFSQLDWTPIRYIHRPVDRDKIAVLYRMAQACLVTSLADGMNLVAKEFVAAQDPEDPGVLILSRFAGAAEDMDHAVLINPYDIEEIAEAIHTALTMPLEERKQRHARCLEAVEKTNVALWAGRYLRVLDGVTRELPGATPNNRAIAG